MVESEPDTVINTDHHEDAFYVFKDGSYYTGNYQF